MTITKLDRAALAEHMHHAAGHWHQIACECKNPETALKYHAKQAEAHSIAAMIERADTLSVIIVNRNRTPATDDMLGGILQRALGRLG